MRTTLVFFICFFGIHLLRADDALRSIQVEARSEVRVAPDEAVLDFYISSLDESIIKAKSINDGICLKIARAIKQLNVEADAFRVTDLQIGPRYDGRPPRLVGYEVIRSFQLRTGAFNEVEPAIAVILEIAGNEVEIDELNFRVKDQRQHQIRARELAMQYAREKAEHLAALNEMKLGQPISISESIEYSDGSNENFSGFGGGFSFRTPTVTQDQVFCVFSPQTSLVQNPEKEELSDEEEDLLLSPGQVSLNASVDVTFELVPQ